MKVKISIASIVPFVFMGAVLVNASYAQPPSPQVSPTVSPATSLPSTPLEQRLEKVEKFLSELNKKIEKPPKDIWDKFSSVSGLLSGILIAVIGGIATYVYREKQRSSEEALKKQELTISQAQTIQNFMPQLKSEDKREVRTALLAIAAVDAKLGTNVAELFGGEEGSEVLSKISSSPNVTQEQKFQAKASHRLIIMRLIDSLRKEGVSDVDKIRRFVIQEARYLITDAELDEILEQIGLQEPNSASAKKNL